MFATAATGNQAPKTSSNLTYDSSSEILSCTDFNTTSDINLKKDIEIITNANEILNQINGVNFTWIKSNKPSIGIIAQEIEKVLPQLVNERTDTGTKSVNYNGLIGVLIEAVKELSQRVEKLEKKVIHKYLKKTPSKHENGIIKVSGVNVIDNEKEMQMSLLQQQHH